MVEVLIGIISGFISGMGMGGGTILILCLSMFMGIEQHIAQATNLVFFIPTSIMAIIINIKQKYVDFKIAIGIAILKSTYFCFIFIIIAIIDVGIKNTKFVA